MLTLKSSLAEAYLRDGQPLKSVELYESAYEARLQEDGPLALSTIVTGTNYAMSVRQTNDRDKAVPILETLLKDARKSLGNDHHQTILLIKQLGHCYLLAAELEQGLPLIEEAYQQTRTLYGPEHKLSLTAASSLGQAYMAKGDYENMARQFKEVYELTLKQWGADHTETLTEANNLATAYQLNGQFEAAIELFESTLAAQTKHLGKAHPNTILSMVNLTSSLHSASRYADSIPVCQEVFDLAEAIEHDHFYSQIAMAREGVAYLKLEDFEAAKTALTKCHDSRIRTMPDHWLRYHTMSLLGEALLGLKDFDRAESLLVEGYQKLVELEPTIPAQGKFRIKDAKERLVRLYEAQKMPDKAAEYRD